MLSILPNDRWLVHYYFIVYDNVFHIERKINYFIYLFLFRMQSFTLRLQIRTLFWLCEYTALQSSHVIHRVRRVIILSEHSPDSASLLIFYYNFESSTLLVLLAAEFCLKLESEQISGVELEWNMLNYLCVRKKWQSWVRMSALHGTISARWNIRWTISDVV